MLKLLTESEGKRSNKVFPVLLIYWKLESKFTLLAPDKPMTENPVLANCWLYSLRWDRLMSTAKNCLIERKLRGNIAGKRLLKLEDQWVVEKFHLGFGLIRKQKSLS